MMEKISGRNAAPARAGRIGTPIVLLLLLGLGSISHADAPVARILVDNDILGGNGDDNDDLYTASLEVDFQVKNTRIHFHEYLFTDRNGGRRFDETAALVSLAPPPTGPWDHQLAVGITRIGRGVFAQHTQNEVHRIVGSEVLDLDYPDSSDLHPTLRWTATRMSPVTSWGQLRPRVDLEVAAGFRSSATVDLHGNWRVARGIHLLVSAGTRYAETDQGILEPFLETWSAVGSVGLDFNGRYRVAWTYNRFGVGQRHFGLTFRIPVPGSSR